MDSKLKTLISIRPTDDQTYFIIKSGWHGCYYVISEGPAFGDLFHSSELLKRERLLQRFPDINLDEIDYDE